MPSNNLCSPMHVKSSSQFVCTKSCSSNSFMCITCIASFRNRKCWIRRADVLILTCSTNRSTQYFARLFFLILEYSESNSFDWVQLCIDRLENSNRPQFSSMYWNLKNISTNKMVCYRKSIANAKTHLLHPLVTIAREKTTCTAKQKQLLNRRYVNKRMHYFQINGTKTVNFFLICIEFKKVHRHMLLQLWLPIVDKKTSEILKLLKYASVEFEFKKNTKRVEARQ